MKLTEEEYDKALLWVLQIADGSVEVDKQWLKTYIEAPRRGGKGRKGGKRESNAPEVPVVDLALELEGAKQNAAFERLLQDRRAQKAMFDANVRGPLRALLTKSAGKSSWFEKDNLAFYNELLRMWGSSHATRMGGDQWQILGKHTDHRELSRSLVAVLDAREVERDDVVRRERNRLHERGVTTRAAVFSELLCHFFPSRYPIVDAPVRAWRSHVGFDRGVGGTEGDRYLRLTRAMRAAMRQDGPRRLGVKDLAELDALIWVKFQKRKISQ